MLALFILLDIVVMAVFLTAVRPIAAGAAAALANSATADRLAMVAGLAVMLVILGLSKGTNRDH